ncbi:MAG: transposase [Oscillospiraceae bacterium]
MKKKAAAAAVQHPVTKEEMREIISEQAFSESILSIEPSLTSGKWQLLKPDGTTPLQYPPSMPDEIFWQLRFEPAKWIAEKHIVKVYVGTDGLRQDEFLRGDHPNTLFRGSIATASLEATIINTKYVNSNPLDRISREFQTNGLNLSKQTMSNWTVWSAKRYLLLVYKLMKLL